MLYCFIFKQLRFCVNPLNPDDSFNSDDQFDSNFDLLDVTDSNYLKVTKVGCSGCPVAT